MISGDLHDRGSLKPRVSIRSCTWQSIGDEKIPKPDLEPEKRSARGLLAFFFFSRTGNDFVHVPTLNYQIQTTLTIVDDHMDTMFLHTIFEFTLKSSAAEKTSLSKTSGERSVVLGNLCRILLISKFHIFVYL